MSKYSRHDPRNKKKYRNKKHSINKDHRIRSQEEEGRPKYSLGKINSAMISVLDEELEDIFKYIED